MRGALMIVTVITLLIVGVLVIKNMGADTTGDVTRTEAKEYIERAEDAAEKVTEKAGLTVQRLQESQ